MKLNNINVTESIDKAKTLLAQDENITPALKAAIEIILLLCSLMAERLSLNSRNSSKPPSTDQQGKSNNNSDKEDKSKKKKRKPGGQRGRKGCQLKPVNKPDKIKVLRFDKRKLSKGHYTQCGFEKRQVFDLIIRLQVTEYQAEVWVDEQGNRYTASFPKGVTRPVQYGATIQAQSVYMSQYQLVS